jgi:hypothetical protein
MTKCMTILILNQTLTWFPMDAKMLAQAKKGCTKHYDKCLVEFIKTKELTYRAICGESE